MNKLMTAVDGKKTYIVAVITIIYAVSAAVLGKIDVNTAIEMILAALGAIGFRSAMNK